MRKHTKIVSLLLVLATLVGVFAVLPGAPIVKASADTTPASESEPFTPSATTVEATTTADIISSVAGNQVSGIGLSNFTNAELVKHYQTTTSSNNVYSTLHTLQSTSGNLGINPFLNVTVGGTKALNFDTGYYVIEADLASETEAINYLSFSPIIDFSKSSSATRLDPGGQLWSSDMSINDGRWHHYVVVGDLANNASYHFIDGKLVKTGVAYKADRKETQDAANANTVYSLSNVRIDIYSGGKTVADQSVSVDNVAVRVLASDDSNLAVALANKDINSWSKAVTAPTEKKLPTVATVDGVEYSNVNDVTAALDGNLVSKKVELNREYLGTITVNGSAIVETNGCTAPTAGTDARLVSDSSNVCKYVATNLSTETMSPSAADIFGATASYDLAGGKISDAVNAQLVRYLVTDRASGNKYLDIRPAETLDTTLTDDGHINWLFTKTTIESESFVVFEFDAYVENGLIDDLRFYLLSRNSSSSGKYGTATYLVNLKLEAGKWSHVTVIGSASTSNTYVFVNNKYVRTETQGFIKGGYASGDTFEGVRFHFGKSAAITSEQNFAIDKVSYRVNVNDSWLTQNVAKDTPVQDLSAWENNAFNSSYELPALTPIASVDSELVYSAAELTEKLSGDLGAEKHVELYSEAASSATVACDAVVETFGFTAPAAGIGSTTVTNGTEVTYDFSNSITLTPTVNGSDLLSATKDPDVADNKFSSYYIQQMYPGTNYTEDLGYPAMNIATDNITGETFLYREGNPNYDKAVDPSTGNVVDNNSYFNWQVTTYQIKYDLSNPAWNVLDFDFARTSDVKTFSVNSMTFWNDGGNYEQYKSITLDDYLNKLEVGKFHHITMAYDFNNNKTHIFINGVKVGTGTATTNETDYTSFKNGRIYNFSGYRIAQNSGSEYILDNVAIRNLTGVNSTEIANALSLGSLGYWSGAITAPKSTFPAVASVNGEAVENYADLNKLLLGNEQLDVELLREPCGTVTVNTNAVVDANAYTAPTAGTDVTVTANGVVSTYKTNKFNPNATTNVDTSDSNVINAVKSPNGANLFSTFVNNIQSANGMYSEIVTNTSDGTDYLRVVRDGVYNDGYFEARSQTKISPNENTQYYVFEMDVALLSDVTVALSTNPRTSGGLWGAENPSLTSLLGNYEKGVMHHVTAIYNIDENSAQFYVGDTLVKDLTEKGYTSAANHESVWVNGTGFTFYGIRIAGNLESGGGFALDNVCIRYIEEAAGETAANSLTAAMTEKKLSNWQGATTTVSTETQPVAKYNGNDYYSLLALSGELTAGSDVKKVDFLASHPMPLTVSCRADVETHGFAVNLVKSGIATKTVTNGTVVSFYTPNSWAEEKTSGDVTDAVLPKQNVGFTAAALANWNTKTITGEVVTELPSGEKYFNLTSVANASSANHFVQISGATEKVDLYGKTGYYVIDLDLASATEFINQMSVSVVNRYFKVPGDNSTRIDYDVSSPYFTDLLPADGAWHHLTIVGDVANNKMYCYVDGILVNSNNKAYKESATLPENAEANPTLSEIRINIGPSVAMDIGDQLSLDNCKVRVVYDTALADIIANGSHLSAWSGNEAGKGGKLPSIATVDGVEYYTLDELAYALSVGSNHIVTLNRQFSGTVNLSTTAIIDTWGLDNFLTPINGINIKDNGDGTVTAYIETENGTIVVTINGTPAINAEVLKGTDIADYLHKNHAYIFDVIAAGGTIYTGATWDTVPSGTVTDTHTYNVTATEYEGDLLVLDASGAQVTTGDSLEKQLATTGDNFFIFGKDAILNLDAEDAVVNGIITVVGANELHLLGHTLTVEGTGSHRLAFQSTAGDFSVIGGKLSDTTRTQSQALFWLHYNFANSVNLIGVDVTTTNVISDIRGGTVNVDGCTINALNGVSNQAFQLAEYHNVECTSNVVTLNITHSKINCDYEGKRFIFVKYIEQWGADTGKEAEAATKMETKKAEGMGELPHRVNISYSMVNINGSTPLVHSINPYAEVLLKNTTLCARSPFDLPSESQVMLSDKVFSTTPIDGTLIGKVQAVKSNDPVAPYAYSVDYATVTWNGGNEEYWIAGSIPSNPNAVNAPVSVVEAGKTYNFVSGSEDVEIKMNVTLGTSLTVNVYLPTASDVTAVTVGGVEMALNNVVALNGNNYYKLSYDLLPHEASRALDVVMTVGGKTYARTVDLIEYCEIALEGFKNDKDTVTLLNAILHYVIAAAEYTNSFTAGIAKIDNIVISDVVVDDVRGLNAMAKLSDIITARSLNLAARPAWRLYYAEGTDLSKLTVTVGGEEIAYTDCGGYIEFELTADQMIKAVSVNYDGNTGRFDLKAYLDTVKAATDAESKAAAPLVEAFYDYVYAAAQYKN